MLFLLVAHHWLSFFLLALLGSVIDGNAAQRNKATLGHRFFQNLLAIERLHAGIFGVLLQLGIPSADLLFARGLGNAQIIERVVALGIYVFEIELQLVGRVLQADFLAAGEDLMASMLLVPLGQRGGHVHLLDDVAPAHTGVIGAE